MKTIEKKQKQLISLVKNYFNIFEKKTITTSISPKCYITTWTLTRGYFKLMEIIGKNSLNSLVFILKDILAISTLYDYDITYKISTNKNKNLLISYCSKNNFDRNGNFKDKSFNLKSIKKITPGYSYLWMGIYQKTLKKIFIFFIKNLKTISAYYF